MNEDLKRQDEALDALLKNAETPKAPAWFEARTLARLRREREDAPFFSFNLFRCLGAGACLALLVLGVLRISGWEGTRGSPEVAAVQVQDEQLYAAFEAFDSYTRQAKEWNQEPY